MGLLFATMSLSTSVRVAIVVGLLCLAGAVLVTFAPSFADDGSDCGTWVAPEFGEDEVTALLETAGEQYDRARAAGQDELAGQALVNGARVRQAGDECGATLGTRRAVALSLGGLALVGPAAVMFIGRGREEKAAPAPHRAA